MPDLTITKREEYGFYNRYATMGSATIRGKYESVSTRSSRNRCDRPPIPGHEGGGTPVFLPSGGFSDCRDGPDETAWPPGPGRDGLRRRSPDETELVPPEKGWRRREPVPSRSRMTSDVRPRYGRRGPRGLRTSRRRLDPQTSSAPPGLRRPASSAGPTRIARRAGA